MSRWLLRAVVRSKSLTSRGACTECRGRKVHVQWRFVRERMLELFVHVGADATLDWLKSQLWCVHLAGNLKAFPKRDERVWVARNVK
eukprot:2044347-Pyramimonas_sp.AAC.1